MAQKKAGHRKHIPLRSCIVCHQQMDKRQLTRIVRTADSGVIVDPTGKRNGRGAYLCDQPLCWEQAITVTAHLNRALNTSVTPDDLATIAHARPESIKNTV